MTKAELLARCEELYEDLDLTSVREWKEQNPGGRAVGYLPTYVPREILHAAGVLPVGILGAGEQLEIVRGDACFQSYICHLPRSVVELGLSGRLDVLDGMIFPSTCDVIRNLSGIWRILFPDKYTRYLDVPQNFAPEVGGAFYEVVLRELWSELCALSGREPDDEALRAAITLYDANRKLVRELYDLRAAEPWRAPASEAYLLLRAGMVLPVEEHTRVLAEYLALVREEERAMVDNARVLLTGAFCEQPPLTLIRTLERAGCDLIDDDFMPVLRWLGHDAGDALETDGDPVRVLAEAYLGDEQESACRFVPDGQPKGARLVETVRRRAAEGVVCAAPSFCDPALLERPMLQSALDEAGIAYTAFKYAENTGQMQPIREQAGTFADTIKLWGDE
ncbi:MAG: benzoyl-CoA reductase subunit C [Planctomycetota bacterium]|nr:MAG: benzoyl-CoA reductase subunit C [Planctomycetota bacterium]